MQHSKSLSNDQLSFFSCPDRGDTRERRPEKERAESVEDEFAEGKGWDVADSEDNQHC